MQSVYLSSHYTLLAIKLAFDIRVLEARAASIASHHQIIRKHFATTLATDMRIL